MQINLKLKAATRDAVSMAGGPQRAALVSRGSASRLCEYGSVGCEDRYIPVDVAMALEADIGAPVISRAMADALGFDLVPRNPVSDAATIKHQVSESMRGFGNLLADINAALEDGRIDHLEAVGIEKAITPEIERLHSMLASVRKAKSLKAVS